MGSAVIAMFQTLPQHLRRMLRFSTCQVFDLLAARNAGGDDLITEGETGFLVPIRAPEAIAEKLNWCATNRANLSGMAIAAQKRASELTWHDYGEKVVAAIRSLTGE